MSHKDTEQLDEIWGARCICDREDQDVCKVHDTPEETLERLKQCFNEATTKARVDERNIERQELIAAYKTAAHNSGFGRQLKDNLKRNADRLAQLQPNTLKEGEE